jgi:hypothetical protein
MNSYNKIPAIISIVFGIQLKLIYDILEDMFPNMSMEQIVFKLREVAFLDSIEIGELHLFDDVFDGKYSAFECISNDPLSMEWKGLYPFLINELSNEEFDDFVLRNFHFDALASHVSSNFDVTEMKSPQIVRVRIKKTIPYIAHEIDLQYEIVRRNMLEEHQRSEKDNADLMSALEYFIPDVIDETVQESFSEITQVHGPFSNPEITSSKRKIGVEGSAVEDSAVKVPKF